MRLGHDTDIDYDHIDSDANSGSDANSDSDANRDSYDGNSDEGSGGSDPPLVHLGGHACSLMSKRRLTRKDI